MTPAGRRLDVPGTHNLRDLGGYPVGGGATLAPGRLFRSEALSYPGASEEHAIWDGSAAAELGRLGLRTVVDLRSDVERSTAPSAWTEATGAEVVSLPIAEGGAGSATDIMGDLVSGASTHFGVDEMVALYAATLERRGETFAAAVQLLAEPARYPVLVHCSAGKDRTGLLVALVLSALGTPRDVVVGDYALTGTYRPDRVLLHVDRFAALGLDPDDVRVLFETPAEVMERTLAHLDAEHGGAVAYLGAAGVTAEVLDGLRRGLVLS